MPTDADVAALLRRAATLVTARARRERSEQFASLSPEFKEALANEDDKMGECYTRAADAIEDLAATRRALDDAIAMSGEAHEENARLRAAIENIQRWANEMTQYSEGEWVLYDDVIAALRKPDAAK